MTSDIKESDWKLFRRLHTIALERFCRRVIEEINRASGGCEDNCHQHYLELFDLILKRNEEMARAFDDMRRSTAIVLLANIKESDLLTEEEFSQFSQETQNAVASIFEIRRG